ncbi:MAG TPA: TetR/AcrR family transcriptional regulator [Actinophytocola sp.]|uniref:TetR/AcrR family transcriptional regulator n=1 Tax=Actinophytocola sp. TaxID=1872138 RepID=UPI002DBBD26A|nr:TetR/AcrR family transcriptional regulator [Actinophytocola sp.]HEU5473412.1 TetR/AcrR family transcriptional regulator [Actinophytocola sp.]
MPTPWSEMVEAHRRGVREAILDATAALVAERGPDGVTMEEVAKRAGIRRVRLSMYFSDLESLLRAWHERQLHSHLGFLEEVRDKGAGDLRERLESVLRAYVAIVHQTHRHHHTEHGIALHQGEHLENAQRHLHETVRDLIAEGAAAGQVRSDIPPDELTAQCLDTLSEAIGLSSAEDIRRLIAATLADLNPPEEPG